MSKKHLRVNINYLEDQCKPVVNQFQTSSDIYDLRKESAVFNVFIWKLVFWKVIKFLRLQTHGGSKCCSACFHPGLFRQSVFNDVPLCLDPYSRFILINMETNCPTLFMRLNASLTSRSQLLVYCKFTHGFNATWSKFNPVLTKPV